MNQELIVFLALLGFIVINFFLLRIATKIDYIKYGQEQVNPMGVFIMFLSFIGTFILLMILLVESGILDYKPKK